MKKVLILAYDFPPYVSVGGLRPYSWYKYFKEFGLYPIVVTRQWENKYGNQLDYIAPSECNKTIIEEAEFGTIIRTPYKPNLSNRLLIKYGEKRFRLLRKIITAYYEFMQFVFFVGPKSGLFFGAKEYIKANKVDYIIATGEPFVLFKYASSLSATFKIPWIADYRDPWSQNKIRSANLLLYIYNRYNEKKFIKNANQIITVNDFFVHKIRALINNKNVSIVANGFDPEIQAECLKVSQTSTKLSIAFVGTVYPWHPIASVLEVLDNFVKAGKDDIILNFYGINNSKQIEKHLEMLPYIKANVKIHDKVPYEIMMRRLAENNLLLLFNYYSFIGTKIYDYLAANRKILFCYSEDANAEKLKNEYFVLDDKKWSHHTPQEDLIRLTQSGIIVKDEEHLFNVLAELCSEFDAKSYIENNAIGVENYSRKVQSKILANLIKENY